MGARLCLHHVGGRSGTSAFPVLPSFERDFIRVLYDADVDCLPDAQVRNQESEAEQVVLPHCLAAAAGTAELHITYDPFNSSLRPSNPRYHAYYSGADPAFDYVFAESTQVVERRSLPTISLDELVASGRVVPPDFLSIDTEGTELEILEGAGRTLRSSVLGLIVEVEFHELYEGQRLFGDVQHELSRQGFDFVRFLHLGEMSPCRAPVGLRGEGYQTGGDALFLRRLDAVGEAGDATVIQLRKLAFFAFVFKQFEFGIQCLHASRRGSTDGHGIDDQPRRAYDTCLDELDEAIRAAPAVLPPTFASLFSAAESKIRCEANPPRLEPDSALKAAVRRIPWVFGPLKSARRSVAGAGRRARRGAAALSASLPGRSHSPVERILMRYGLQEQADVLRLRRLAR